MGELEEGIRCRNKGCVRCIEGVLVGGDEYSEGGGGRGFGELD